IPAIIDDFVLAVALEKLLIRAESFKAEVNNFLFLYVENGVMLECLYRQYKVLAAKEYIPASRWWIVDLYRSG
ncbi:hypothetical protein DL98DRAFT_437073, partial [Cadophora sp. DSE1049]